MWEGWKAGFMAFHAFHTLSFPWPALGAGSGCEVAEKPFFGNFAFIVHAKACRRKLRLLPGKSVNPCRLTGTYSPMNFAVALEFDFRTFLLFTWRSDVRGYVYVWKVIEISQLRSFCWLLRRSGNTGDKKPESPAAKICSSTIPRGVRCSEATKGKVPL